MFNLLLSLVLVLGAHRAAANSCFNLMLKDKNDKDTEVFEKQFNEIEVIVRNLALSKSMPMSDFKGKLRVIYSNLKGVSEQAKIWQNAEVFLAESVLQKWQKSYPDGWTPEMWNVVRQQSTSMRGFFNSLERLKEQVPGDLMHRTVGQITNTWANLVLGNFELVKSGVRVEQSKTRLLTATRHLVLFRIMAERYSGRKIPDNLSFLD